MADRREVLVVTVPAGSMKRDELPKFREYIIESILRDVLVLDDNMSHRIEEMPCVGSMPEVAVVVEDRPAPEAEKPLSMKEIKQDILRRLKERRDRIGVGAYNHVAAACRSKTITADNLRKLVVGDIVLQPHEWLAIGRALDKVDAKEREAQQNDA